MADENIAAKIVLSVEYADAVQKCTELETGIEQVTEARQADLNAAKETAQASTANAKAMEREAAAAKNVAKAETDWVKDVLKQRRDFEKFVRDEERKEKENPALQSDRDALKDRQRVMRETQREQTRLAEMSNAVLDEEIKDQKILLAEKRKQLAIEKEILLQRKLNDVRDQLENPSIRKTPGKYLEALQAQDTHEQQSMRNTREILNAERDLRKAHKASLRDYRGEFSKNFMSTLNSRDFSRNSLNVAQGMQKITKTMGKANGVFQKAARGIGRSLGYIARIGGRGLGMEMTTEGMSGPGGAFMAAGAAVGSLSLLANRAIALGREGREYQREDARRLSDDFAEITQNIREENNKRKEYLSTLQQINNSEELTNTQRVQQEIILRKLNSRLGVMSAEVDKASNRVKNLGSIEEQTIQRDTKRELDAMLREQRAIQSQTKSNEEFLGSGSSFFADAWHNLVNGDEIRAVSRENNELAKKNRELTKAIAETRKKLSGTEIIDRWKTRNAQLEDDIKNLQENQLQRDLAFNRGGNAWKIRRDELARYSETRLNKLKKLTSAEKLVEIQMLKNSNITSVQGEYNNQLTEYKNNLLEIERIEKKHQEHESFNRNISRELANMREQITLQGMINRGNKTEADLTKMILDARRKITESGWSPEQAQSWLKYSTMAKDQESRWQQQTAIGGFIQRESFKLLPRTTTAVMANSMEGLRLQSRMLSPNTPEQRTLKLAQSQNATLKDIRRLLQNINLGSGAALKVRSV